MRIKNWRQFQHYKKRNPPWIRLYRDLLNDREWMALSGDASKLLANCWLIAAERDGELPPLEDVAWRLRIDMKKATVLFSQLNHWLENDASTMLAERKQLATPETETETDKALSTRARGKHSLPKDWTPPRGAWKIAEGRGMSPADYIIAKDGFVDYCRSRDWRMVDWDSTFRNWIRREKLHGQAAAVGKSADKRNPSIRDTFDALDATIAEMERRESEARQGNGAANVVILPRLREGTT